MPLIPANMASIASNTPRWLSRQRVSAPLPASCHGQQVVRLCAWCGDEPVSLSRGHTQAGLILSVAFANDHCLATILYRSELAGLEQFICLRRARATRIKVPYFAMVNLIAGERIVPELVQGDFTAERVVARLREILPDSPARTTMLEGLAKVKARLRSPSERGSAADRAADAVLTLASREVKSQSA